MKMVLLIAVACMIAGCTNEKSELYDQAVEAIKERLKAPSTAKFESYDEGAVHIMDSAGTGNPITDDIGLELRLAMPDSLREKLRESDNTVYQAAQVVLTYEAQNSYGVPIKSTKKVLFKRWMYPDKSGKWELLGIAE